MLRSLLKRGPLAGFLSPCAFRVSLLLEVFQIQSTDFHSETEGSPVQTGRPAWVVNVKMIDFSQRRLRLKIMTNNRTTNQNDPLHKG